MVSPIIIYRNIHTHLQLSFQLSLALGIQVIHFLVCRVLRFQKLLHQSIQMVNTLLYFASLYLGIQPTPYSLASRVNKALITGKTVTDIFASVTSTYIFCCIQYTIHSSVITQKEGTSTSHTAGYIVSTRISRAYTEIGLGRNRLHCWYCLAWMRC